jgi:hypothetical protein
VNEDLFTDIIRYAEASSTATGQKLGLKLSEKLERQNKLQNRRNGSVTIDKSFWVRNFSNRDLDQNELSVLQKGLNFAVTPKVIPKLEIASCIEANISKIPEKDRMAVRSEVCNILKSARIPRRNVTREELSAIQRLKKDSNIVIMKADKGNCVVVLNKSDYDTKMSDLLSDPDTYKKLKKDPSKLTERRMNAKLLLLKRNGKFSDSTYYNLRSTDAVTPRIYGLIKVHKENFPLRPIVSFVGSATYNLSKHLGKILSPLVGKNSFSVKNSYEFVDFLKRSSFRPNDIMVSFDVISLFTKIPISLAIEVVKEMLDADDSLKDRTLLSCDDILDLLEFCLHSTYFMFGGKMFSQTFGCAMGSPISTIVANLVMENLENRIFSQNVADVLFWKRFVDDSWVVIKDSDVQKFFNFINQLEPSIAFTMEKENGEKSITFLDVCITRCDDFTFRSSVFHKPTHTDRYLDYASHHPAAHKRSVVKTLHYRARQICSNAPAFQTEVDYLKCVFKANNYPASSVHKCLVASSNGEARLQQLHRRIVLPYVSGCSERIARVLKQFDIFTVYKPFNKLSSIFRLPKDPLPENAVCGVVYEIPCADCEKVYVGQTGNSLATRLQQHRAACRNHQPEKSALAEHSLNVSHRVHWSGARVLAREANWRQRLFLEAVHTKRRGALNRCESSSADFYSCI